ncbi:MAG TPA: phosphatidylglycerophosphatase A, partial [Minicystis sp.]|nr:phosphatidylglycerophosphatase A [Minicystis sp.]
LLRRRGRGAVALGAVAASVVGVWAASIVEEELGVHDAQVIVVDEVAGLLVTMLGARRRGDVLRGVALFRAFDVLKPWPCRAAARLPRGLGVVADDLVAGVFAALVLRALR